MLYSNNKNNNIPANKGKDDLFDRKKVEEEARKKDLEKRKQEQIRLAEEAKREKEAIQKAQKEVERGIIQQQIDNKEREVGKIEQELRRAGALLTEKEKEIEQAKKEVFRLQGEIKESEGGISYLADEVDVHNSREKATTAKLQEIGVKKNEINRGILDFEQKIKRLNDELTSLLQQADLLRKEISAEEQNLSKQRSQIGKLEQEYKTAEMTKSQTSGNKFKVNKGVSAKQGEIKRKSQEQTFKQRVVEQATQGAEKINQEITKLKKELDALKQEIKSLEVRRDNIKS